MAEASSDRQEAQRELVEQGRSLPGVAEAIDLFTAASDLVPDLQARINPSHYATGGNA